MYVLFFEGIQIMPNIIKEALLQLVKSGNTIELDHLLMTEINSSEQPHLNLLRSDETVLMEGIVNIYGEKANVIDKAMINYEETKDELENIKRCLKRLISFGSKPIKDLEHIRYLNLSTNTMCSIWNMNAHCLDPETVVLQYLLMLDTPKSFSAYLKYAKTIPHLKSVIDKNTSTIANIQAQLRVIDCHIATATVTPTIEYLLNHSINVEQGWDMKRASLGILSECSCAHYPRELRKPLEDRFLTEALTRYPVKSIDSLNYLSLGSGELLQDLIIIIRLLKVGYTKINISLIEPQIIEEHRIANFRRLKDVANECHASLNINTYISIYHYQRQNGSPIHLATAIDYENIFKEDCFNDVLVTKRLLAESGFFLFAYAEHHFAITQKTLVPIDVPEDAALVCKQLEALRLEEKRDVLTIALNTIELPMMTWAYILPMLNNSSGHTIKINLLAPMKRSYFNNPVSIHTGFTAENIQEFLDLCFESKKTIHVTVYNDLDTLITNSKHQYDIVLQLGLISDNFNDLIHEAKKLMTHSPDAHHYGLMQYARKHAKGIGICNVVQGVIIALPENKAAIEQRMDKIIQVNTHLQNVIAIINQDIERFLTNNTCLESQKIKGTKLTNALNRVYMFALDNLRNDASPCIQKTLDYLLSTKVNGNESLFEIYTNQSSIFSFFWKQSRTIESFVQQKFNINISQNLLEESNREDITSFSRVALSHG